MIRQVGATQARYNISRREYSGNYNYFMLICELKKRKKFDGTSIASFFCSASFNSLTEVIPLLPS